jgi:hypothetical protein
VKMRGTTGWILAAPAKVRLGWLVVGCVSSRGAWQQLSTAYHVQARYERGGRWLSVAWFDRRAPAELTAKSSGMPRDARGAEPLAIRVISELELAREQTVVRAATVMLGRD